MWPGAFSSGGSPQGNSGSTQNNYELTNNTTYIMGAHSFKWGARIRQSPAERDVDDGF